MRQHDESSRGCNSRPEQYAEFHRTRRLRIGEGEGGDGKAVAEEAPTQLASVIPTGESTDVNANSPIVVAFTHAMTMDMTGYMVLHEGDARGSVVPGSWAWNTDLTGATFTPSAPLKPRTATRSTWAAR